MEIDSGGVCSYSLWMGISGLEVGFLTPNIMGFLGGAIRQFLNVPSFMFLSSFSVIY